MIDIVERLHKHADIFEDIEGDLMREAADEIERLRAAIAAEREACAKIADRRGQFRSLDEAIPSNEIAAAIRARGQT